VAEPFSPEYPAFTVLVRAFLALLGFYADRVLVSLLALIIQCRAKRSTDEAFFSVVACLLIICPVGAQKKSSNTSLKETVDWMAKFNHLHGVPFLSATGKISQTNWISASEDCTVEIDHRFLLANPGQSVKETVRIELGDLDPDKVKTTVQSYGGRRLVCTSSGTL
jgi:hypothetical protein